MSDELSIRFNRDELMLIKAALASQADQASQTLAIAIHEVLNQEEPEAKSPVPEVKVEYHMPQPAPTPMPDHVGSEAVLVAADGDEDFVVRSGPEQASFSDGSVVLRQRMSLHPIFGKLHPQIMQPDVFRTIFQVNASLSECERRLKDPDIIKTVVDGDPGNAQGRVHGQLKGTFKNDA